MKLVLIICEFQNIFWIFTKRELTEMVIKQFKFKEEDLAHKFIVESDWNYSNCISKTQTNDWYVTYEENFPNVMQWSSDLDPSADQEREWWRMH